MTDREPNGGRRARICAHEYVYRQFEDVLRVLRANRALLGAEMGPGEDRPDYASRRVARLAVRIDGFNANLLVFRIVGGRRDPVTELAVVTTGADARQPPASAAQHLVENLVLAIEKEVPAPSDGLSVEEAEPSKERGPRAGRPRVVIESSDLGVGYAAESMLRKAGYETALCGGPEELPRHRCPLVTTGRCALVDGADVIVHALRVSEPANARVLQAIKDRYPDKPMVVEITGPGAARHAEALAGCRRVPFPMTRKSLLAAVDAALRGHEPSG